MKGQGPQSRSVGASEKRLQVDVRSPERHAVLATQRLWYAVRFEANLDDVRLHDLRHSVASFVGGAGCSTFVVGKLLDHKSSRSTERHAQPCEDIRRMAAG